jgi:Homeodomain-like domain
MHIPGLPEAAVLAPSPPFRLIHSVPRSGGSLPGKWWYWTLSDAQDAYFFRHHYGWSNRDIARRLGIHPRTVIRYIRMVERGEVPWPPPRYRSVAQVPSRHYRSKGWLTCPECKTRFPLWMGSKLPIEGSRLIDLMLAEMDAESEGS